jgi:LytS/YehU family sensor histidine kinase
MIRPLLLIPFLENSFKHGASQMLTHPWVKLQIRIDEDQLSFNLSNSRPVMEDYDHVKKGIVLNNVKKRLGLLYPGRHTLVISDEVLSF